MPFKDLIYVDCSSWKEGHWTGGNDKTLTLGHLSFWEEDSNYFEFTSVRKESVIMFRWWVFWGGLWCLSQVTLQWFHCRSVRNEPLDLSSGWYWLFFTDDYVKNVQDDKGKTLTRTKTQQASASLEQHNAVHISPIHRHADTHPQNHYWMCGVQGHWFWEAGFLGNEADRNDLLRWKCNAQRLLPLCNCHFPL